MPALEQRVVHCPCGAKLLLRWTWSPGSDKYRVRCPDCGAEHEVQATPPIELLRLDSQGNWEYLTTIDSEPT
jgi:DNA-directed RNA polymerase subunit RPC12/RpoP